MSSDILAIRIGPRFIVVTLLPNLGVTALVGYLVAAGAPGRRPSWESAVLTMSDLGIGGLTLVLIAVVAVSVATHPLNYPMIQILEGYWHALPFGTALQEIATTPKRARHQQLAAQEMRGTRGGVSSNTLAEVQAEREWLPEDENALLPTSLGNALRAGEARAGARYWYDTMVVWPRLVPLLSEDLRAQVADMRNQLDAAARLCALSLLAVPVTVLILVRYDVWMLVPVACYVLSWASYRACVAAAKRFCTSLSVAFDLYHLQLWDALSLERPTDLHANRTRSALLSRMLSGSTLADEEYQSFAFVAGPMHRHGRP